VGPLVRLGEHRFESSLALLPNAATAAAIVPPTKGKKNALTVTVPKTLIRGKNGLFIGGAFGKSSVREGMAFVLLKISLRFLQD
jgi:hypothetical protein